jgi:Protein of unknown function (DUF3108)
MGLLVSIASIIAATQAVRGGPPTTYPFAVGEDFRYVAKLGMLKLGEASMQVAGIDTVRGSPSFLFRFRLTGGNFLFKIDNVLESWTTVGDFKSLRFRNDNRENDRVRLSEYDIYPDSGFFRQRGKAETQPTPAQPLDDAAIFYFVRSTALEVGQTYRFEKYFKNDKNPLLIRVLRRERMELPDGSSTDCLVLNPVIDDRGMFADRAEARLWLTDDARRIPVQIRSRYSFGTVTLRLDKMTLAAQQR